MYHEHHLPTREFSETLCPSRMSSPLTIRPTFGVGGKEASINGKESSSYMGDLLLSSYSSSRSFSERFLRDLTGRKVYRFPETADWIPFNAVAE